MFKSIYWWLRYRLHPSDRYHTVRLNVKPDYHETETRMELAVFELMTEYVDHQLVHMAEMCFDVVAPKGATVHERGVKAILCFMHQTNEFDSKEAAQNRVSYYTRLLEVYDWYYYNKPKVVRNVFSPLSGPNWELESKVFNEQVDHYLAETIQLRRGMWT